MGLWALLEALALVGEHNPTPGASHLGIGMLGAEDKTAADSADSLAVAVAVVVAGSESHSSATQLDIKHRFSTGCT